LDEHFVYYYDIWQRTVTVLCIWVPLRRCFEIIFQFKTFIRPNVLQKGSSWGKVQTHAYHARFPMLYSFNCYHKRVTTESTEYNVRTQKAQFKIDLLMADSSRFIQHVFTKPSQMLPGSFNFVVNLVVQPMTI